jgi:thymidylate synthase
VQSSVGIKEELEYLALMRKILETGKSNNDRTGVGTVSIFGAMLKYDLRDTFPISTTKRIPLRMVFEELMIIVFYRIKAFIFGMGTPPANSLINAA